jgi:hypothetical protein
MYGQSQASQFDKVISQIKSNKPNEPVYRQRGPKHLGQRSHGRAKKSLADELSRYFLDA